MALGVAIPTSFKNSGDFRVYIKDASITLFNS